MENTASRLQKKIAELAKTLVAFIKVLVLGIVAAILYAIPWLLRAAAVVGWLVAGYAGITTVKAIYAPYSPTFPLLALQFAIIVTMVAWTGATLLLNPKNIWGGLAAGGLVLGGFSILANWLASRWQYADLFFRILPPALFSVLLIFETVRLRSMRQNGKATMSVPAFMWLRKSKGGDVRSPGEK
ncbi:MAG: hypothetical protein HYR70_04140 [Chloroflexi bacterium]|nr:hypothetical protein [Chloroflexota bacterium]MBI3340746.1 hypothetical protein [Chloroflexota bacterium]